MRQYNLRAEVFGVAAIFTDILCHTFAISGVLYSRGVSNRKKELRTEQRHIRNNYPNNDLAAFALLADNYESRVCSLVCSKLRKFRYVYVEDIVKKIFIRAYQKLRTLEQWRKFLTWACITISNLCKNRDLLQSRHHSNEFAEAYTPRGWQITSVSPQGNRQWCAENESEVNRMMTIYFCIRGEMEAKV